jgi:site-specific recombinase XerD
MAELTRKLMTRHPEGPLFRCQRGTRWSRQSITARFRKLGEMLRMEGLTAYAFRHSAITDALVKGIPVAVVAELYGTSIHTISRSCSHIDQKHDVLRDAARRAIG